MTHNQVFVKDPEAVLDYLFDWSDWLVTDTITTSTMAAETGITIDDDDNDDTTATVWLSGGTAGEDYRVTNTIVTMGGRTDERTIIARVRER